MTSPLKDRLQQRRELSERCERLAAELEATRSELSVLDAELFARFDMLVDTFSEVAGSLPPRNAEADVPRAPSGARAAPSRHRVFLSRPIAGEVNIFQGAVESGNFDLDPKWRPLMGREVAVQSQKRENPLMEAMKALLREAKRPMKVSEVFEGLIMNGVDIPGKNPRNNVSAYLHNGTEFKRTEDGLWTLAEREEEEEL